MKNSALINFSVPISYSPKQGDDDDLQIEDDDEFLLTNDDEEEDVNAIGNFDDSLYDYGDKLSSFMDNVSFIYLVGGIVDRPFVC